MQLQQARALRAAVGVDAARIAGRGGLDETLQGRIWRGAAPRANRHAQPRHPVDDARVLQVVQRVDERDEVVPSGDRHGPGQVRVGQRDEPEAHLGDDAEVRLREHPVRSTGRSRTCIPASVLAPGIAPMPVRSTSPSASDDLHAAVRVEVVAEHGLVV